MRKHAVRTTAVLVAHALLFIIIAPTAATADNPTLEMRDGKLRLENAFVAATIDPENGAALAAFVVKSKRKQLLASPSFVDSNILVGRRVVGLEHLAFKLTEDSPRAAEEASWELRATLPPDMPLDGENLVGRAWDAIVWHPHAALQRQPYEQIELVKRYRLRRNSWALEVDYELRNTGARPVSVCLGTAISPTGVRLCLPTRDGNVAVDLPLGGHDKRPILAFGEGGKAWLYETPGAWIANVDGEGDGLAAAFDARHVSFLKVEAAKPTVTFARTRVEIPPGGRFRSSAFLMPVQGLARVNGAEGELAALSRVEPAAADGGPTIFRRTFISEMLEEANLDPATPVAPVGEDNDALARLSAAAKECATARLSPIQVHLGLFSARDREVEVVFAVQKNLVERRPPLGTRRASLKAGTLTLLQVAFVPQEAGTHIVHAEVREGDQVVARFEQPVIAGKPKGFYLPAGPPKEGRINEDFYYEQCGRPRQPIHWDWEPTLAVESPHVRLARPLAGGPVRTFIVTPYGRSRDVAELAQRIEMKYDVLIESVWGYDMDVRAVAPVSEVDRLRTLLNRPHDVIILGTFMGQRFPVDVVGEIARQVEEEGTGLIASIAAHLAGPLKEYSDRAKPDKALFPEGRARVARVGKGRVVFFDGTTDRDLRTSWISRSHAVTEYDHDEFARILLWAAGRSPQVSLSIAGAPKSVAREHLSRTLMSVTLRNQGQARFRGTLRLVARKDLEADYPYYGQVEASRRVYPSWEDWASIERPVEVTAGDTSTVRLGLPTLPAGHFCLDVAILDTEGAIVDWRRVPIVVECTPNIAKITLAESPERTTRALFEQSPAQERAQAQREMESRFFTSDQGKVIAVDCVVSGAADGDRLELTAFDPWQRVIFREEKALVRDGQQHREEFRVPLHAAYHRILELKARLYDAAGCVQERRLLGFIQPRLSRLPAFGWVTYSPDSDLRPEVTGYDARHRGFVAMRDIIQHAWCNMNMVGLTDALPDAEDILLPGDEPALPPTSPSAMPDTSAEAARKMLSSPLDLRQGYIRVPCLLDPKVREAILRHKEDYFRTRSRFCRPFNVTMGDEWYYTKEIVDKRVSAGFRRQFILSRDGNICRCPHCLRALRDFASKLYGGDLRRLNTEWSTNYRAWDEVAPPLLSENRVKANKSWKAVDLSTSVSSRPERCPPEEKWPHVIDHRRFIDHQVADLIAAIREAARRGSPTSKLGWGDLMGDTSMWNGLDAYLIAPHMDFNGLDHEINIWQSLGHPDNAHFVGYAKQYSRIRESTVPWYMMFEGCTSIANWNSGEYPKHRMDYTFFDAAHVIFDTMREIRGRGFDRLLVGHRYRDPVAILYDPRSIYVSEMQEWQEDQAKFFRDMAIASRSHTDTCKKVEQSYAALLAEHYLQYYTVAYGHLEEGHFGKFGKPRVLFLPYTQCLSTQQAATLEKFAREGGILVGDVHTGFRDEHGKRLAQGSLNHVFGIRQTTSSGMRVRQGADGTRVAVRFDAACGGPFALAFLAVGPGDVAPTTARAHARYSLGGREHPAFLVNEFGQGKAIYLNFLPAGYREVVGDIVEGEGGQDDLGAAAGAQQLAGTPAERFRAVFATILRLAGVQDPVVCEGYPGIYRFGEGRVEYLGVDVGYKNPERWRTYEIRLRDKRHVYDCRRGQYLGYDERIKVQCDAENLRLNHLFALMPYRVEGVRLQLHETEVPRGGTLTLSAQLLPEEPRRERHVLSLCLLNPNGEEMRHYGTCLETRDGIATGRVDFALNDMPGRWKLRLTDAATGMAAEAEFLVK